MEAPWRQDPFSKLLGVLKLDESEDTTDQYPYSLERGYLHAVDVAARCVAAKYNWTVSGAVGFLLANWAPISKVAKVEYRINEIDQKPACTSTITLTVDATLSPEEVMAIYAKSRRDILPYHRSLQQKSLNLANHVFSQTFIGTPRDPGPQATEQEISHFWNEWKYLLERWNEEVDLYGITGSKNEDAKYSKPSMFRDHAYRARDLLIFPSLENPEKTVVYPNLKEIGLKP